VVHGLRAKGNVGRRGADVHATTSGATTDIHWLGAMAKTRIVWEFALRGAS
jgi:hypothetical protein